MSFLKGGQKKLKFVMLILLSGIAIMTLLHVVVDKIFYINHTDSAPKGIYCVSLNQTLHYGDSVIVSLPVDVPSLHVQKGFLLLKTVKGFPGDRYQVFNDELEIRGETYKIFKQRGLPQLELGEKLVPEDSFLLLNDMDFSFDSRYLGPMERQLIVTKVNLLVPYEPFISFMKRVMTDENT